MKNDVLRYLDHHYGDLVKFWLHGTEMPSNVKLEAHCDIIYTFHLLGELHTLNDKAKEAFINVLKSLNLPGWVARTADPTVSVHNCAYAFGALNLLAPDRTHRAELYDNVLDGRQLALPQLVDAASNKPVFPAKWAHHNWRVSHWIGGVPSIILSVAESGSRHQATFSKLLGPVRNATDTILDQNTGLIRAYRSDLVQKLFRVAYSLRHNPSMGDVGGVAHILWFDHATGRRYVGLESLLARAEELFFKRPRFMEKVPYCLDFDIVQIVRTALEQTGREAGKSKPRALTMMADIEGFYAGDIADGYSLHKVPGALATYHECAFIAQTATAGKLGIQKIDIIKDAHWL